MSSNTEIDSPNPQSARRKWLLSASVLIVVIVSSLAPVDRVAEAEFETLFQRALVTFALARTLNGMISAVQGTELALQPAGVGVTLTPGQILDPVNDLVERFSWIMLGATLSLGVQQVLLDFGQWWVLKLLVALAGLAWLWFSYRREGAGKTSETAFRFLSRALILLLFIRFAVPVTMIANEWLYELFLESRYQESTQIIEEAGADLEQVSEQGAEESDGDEEVADTGLLESFGQALSTTRQSMDVQARVDRFKERSAELVEHLIQLCVVFILQTGILPIAFLWLFLKLLGQVFRNGFGDRNTS